MTTPTTPIAMSDVNAELGYPTTQTVSLGDQYVVNLAGGNHDMNDLRNKSSVTIPYQSSGAGFYTVYDGYGNPAGTGPGYALEGCTQNTTGYTPSYPYTYSVTSHCARPQQIYGVASVITGTNNYGNYKVIRSDGTLMAQSGSIDQLAAARGGTTIFYLGFYDTLPAYGTLYYGMLEQVGDRGDYCYGFNAGVDGVGAMTFQFNYLY